MLLLWNGRRLAFRDGDSAASALHRNGIRTIAITRKRHAPLGLSGSFVAGVLARVDGRPNVRLDLERASAGMRIEQQNVWPGPRTDLLRLLRLIPAPLVRGGFEHGRWTPSRGRSFAAWERLASALAGVASPPDHPSGPVSRGRRAAFDVVVVGGGPAGRAAANEAARRGERVALVSRGEEAGRFAAAMGEALPPLHPSVAAFLGVELFGVYRQGRLLAGAPARADASAVVFDTDRTVLATGRRSVPPLVPGAHLPGVMDAHAAIMLSARHACLPGARVAVVGSGAEGEVARRLAARGAEITHQGPVGALRRVHGRSRVTAIDAGRRIACDAVVHAGPWCADPNLRFQAEADGLMQLEARSPNPRVAAAGTAALPDEALPVPAGVPPGALVCPCMDVTAGEILARIDEGETDPEVLKRLTSCGMGPCQGFPCWEHMLSLLAMRTGLDAAALPRPSHRAPRRAITVGQAAGLHGLIEADA